MSDSLNMRDAVLMRELNRLKEEGLYRDPACVEGAQGPRVEIGGTRYLCFCSNNYLSLANHPEVAEAARRAIDRYGWGSGASRLVSGTMRLHRRIEEELASFKKAEAAILFATGYMANLGVISALAGMGDAVIIDTLDHASIIDGCRLSGARLRVYPHRNMEALERILRSESGARRRLVITDTIFSMDGDLAPLGDIVSLARRHGAWVMADEAHATGVLGAQGRGAAELLGVEEGIDISLGTLSKALGGEGGFVTGSAALVDSLRNRARSFIYTTAPPPAVCAAGLAALEIVRREPGRRAALLRTADALREGLDGMGLDTMGSSHHIIPLLVGEAEQAVRVSRALRERGILAPAIRPPTVPRGTSRLRLTVMADHTGDDIRALLEAVARIAEEGVLR
ncbi:MAG: 8-amino-7-oxononanoate synthase [Candidatus Aureabacteria bacterium]|nr:8-amino-7-oxononanoate synthase [Candidatus Auribacterota bacterium]